LRLHTVVPSLTRWRQGETGEGRGEIGFDASPFPSLWIRFPDLELLCHVAGSAGVSNSIPLEQLEDVHPAMLTLPLSTRRVVLIGASNVTLSFPLLINSLIQSSPEPLEIFAAHGHGRSFCHWSYVLHRGLPPVPGCGIWESLRERPPVQQTWGLVTDVGNDLIYGRTVEDVLQNVDAVLQRLAELQAAITFVRLPLERILMLSEFRYRVVKQMLFPGPTVPWNVISQRVIELDERVAALASSLNARVLTPRVSWYGVDPIHIRQSRRVAAWREILQSWSFPFEPVVSWPSQHASLRIWRSPPAERSYWKQIYHTLQPGWLTSQGNSLWQY